MPPARHDSPAGIFRRILVGFDGSAEAQHALRVGIALASEVDGRIDVLLVVRPPAHTETGDEGHRALESERENLSRGLAEVEGLSPYRAEISTDVVVSDNPAHTIALYAEEHGFDLVIVGTHGREQPTHRGIGRSVESLLRHHPCPVLVV